MQNPFSAQPALFVTSADLEHSSLQGLDGAEAVLDWPALERIMAGIYASKIGRPSYPLLTLLRASLLGIWYRLSDVELAQTLFRDLLFRKFCHLELGGDVPDATTIGRFRQKLVEHDLWEVLLDEVNRQLEAKRIIMTEGRINIIDATPVEYAKIQDEPSKPESSNSVNFGSIIVSDLEGDLDNFTPHSSGAFKAEVSAEEYFNSHRGKQARGIFQKVDVIRWDHVEEDWTLEGFEFESPANSIDTSSARPPRENQQQQETSGSLDGSFQHLEAFVRLREFALRRRWLSAAAALDKASRQSAPLSKRERAAIEHVLNVAGTFTRHRSDSDLLRRALPNAENRKDAVEPVHQSARPKKATAAKVTNRKPPDSKSNTEHGMPTQKEIISSVLRVRQIAAERSWLSPKSSRALAKLSDKKAALGRSETNSLNYLLGRFENISELTVDVENLRKRIGSKVERRG